MSDQSYTPLTQQWIMTWDADDRGYHMSYTFGDLQTAWDFFKGLTLEGMPHHIIFVETYDTNEIPPTLNYLNWSEFIDVYQKEAANRERLAEIAEQKAMELQNAVLLVDDTDVEIIDECDMPNEHG